jgi:hypothetical protein
MTYLHTRSLSRHENQIKSLFVIRHWHTFVWFDILQLNCRQWIVSIKTISTIDRIIDRSTRISCLFVCFPVVFFLDCVQMSMKIHQWWHIVRHYFKSKLVEIASQKELIRHIRWLSTSTARQLSKRVEVLHHQGSSAIRCMKCQYETLE